jgi:hypothetical protein
MGTLDAHHVDASLPHFHAEAAVVMNTTLPQGSSGESTGSSLGGLFVVAGRFSSEAVRFAVHAFPYGA